MPRRPTATSSRVVSAAMASDCLASRARLLSRTLTSLYDEALRPLGLTAGQLNLLAVVDQLGPVAPGEVSRRLNMDKSTVSRTVTRMHESGWLAVTEGGRGQLLGLSATGRGLLVRAYPHWEKAQEDATALLGGKAAQALRRAADAARERP